MSKPDRYAELQKVWALEIALMPFESAEKRASDRASAFGFFRAARWSCISSRFTPTWSITSWNSVARGCVVSSIRALNFISPRMVLSTSNCSASTVVIAMMTCTMNSLSSMRAIESDARVLCKCPPGLDSRRLVICAVVLRGAVHVRHVARGFRARFFIQRRAWLA